MTESNKPFRLVQVSDTHLSRQRAYFHDNWLVFLAAMQADPPDLVVVSGDLSFDGAAGDDDLAFAKAEFCRLPCPWIAIPGNHDIGESPLAVRLDQPVDVVRMARWRKHVGPQWWTREVGAWCLLGIDTALLGSDCESANEQWRFIETELEARAGQPILAFQHIPPFLADPDDTAATKLAVPFAVRGRLLDLYVRGRVRRIASGHVHVHREMDFKGIPIIWAPATSFFNIVEHQKAGRGVPRPGYIEWTLRGSDISHRLIEPPLMLTHDVGLWNAAHGSTTKLPPRPL